MFFRTQADGTAQTWGAGRYGGDSSGADLTDVAEVSCGGYACGAIKNDGTAEFWGSEKYGANWSSTEDIGKSEDIAGIGCVEYAAGCWAWTTSGIGYTWGNSYTDDGNVALTDLEDLVCGAYDCIGLKTDGTAVVWGYYWDNNYDNNGEAYGMDDYLSDVSKIGCGIYACWIIKTDGYAIAFGEYGYGTVEEVDLWDGVEDFSMHGYEGAVLLTDGTVNFSGYNTANQYTTDAVKVSCGGYQCAVLKTDGTVEGFGDDSYLANISNVGGDVIDISCGGYACVALKSDGTVKGFGDAYYGAEIPEGLTDVAEVNCGIWYSGCTAIKTDGTGVVWGDYGTIGQGDSDDIVGDPDEIDLVNDCVPTPSPTSHPTPSATCVDDSSWYKGAETAKDCVWVGEKKNKRCSKMSNDMIPASSACKASCNTCFTPTSFPTTMPTPCGDLDSTTWHKWRNPNKDCDWVAKRPKKRCSIGAKKLDNGAFGNFAKEECRAACCDY